MAAPAAWREELRCNSPAKYERACAALQHFLDVQYGRPGIGTLVGDCLDLEGMGIEALPPSYFALPIVTARLGGLYCDHNALTLLPEELGLCTYLTEFHCDNNRLTSVPVSLLQLPNLEDFSFSDNKPPTKLPSRRVKNKTRS